MQFRQFLNAAMKDTSSSPEDQVQVTEDEEQAGGHPTKNFPSKEHAHLVLCFSVQTAGGRDNAMILRRQTGKQANSEQEKSSSLQRECRRNRVGL